MRLNYAFVLLLLPALFMQEPILEASATSETTIATGETTIATGGTTTATGETTTATGETTLAAGGTTCGTPSISPNETNFLGPYEAQPHSWPWTVSLRMLDDHQCGGTIVNENWIVTAAHCLDVDVNNTPSMWSAHAGRHCRDCEEATMQKRFINKVVMHPSYTRDKNYDHDLALLRVHRPFEFNSHVMPTCLPTDALTDAAKCVGAGWGTQGAGKNLIQVVVPVIAQAICSDFFHYDDSVTKNMLCAGYEESSKDPCFGDIGGPLMCKSGNAWHLHGVTSWGEACAMPQRPEVYTRVHLFTSWIREIASSH